MKSRLAQSLILSCLIVTGGTVWANAPTPDEAVVIGSRLELFVDELLVDQMEGVRFQLHHPQKLPLADSPLVGYYATVIKDGDLFRGFYRGDDPAYTGKKDYSGHPGETTCYAESKDGHEWTFPRLGIFEVGGTKNNNVILANNPPFCHNFSPFLDTRPGVDEKERFKALAGHPGYDRRNHGEGLHAFTSSDGIYWTKTGDKEVIPFDPAWPHAFDSQNVSFWSEAEQQYVCYFRTWKTKFGQLRTISRSTSPDFQTWSAPVAMGPNLRGEHLYTSNTQPYFRAPHLYIALPTRFQPDRGDSTDILFMATRAGSETYDRLFTEAFIRPGRDSARWGNRSNYAALNVVPTGEGEMSIYHAVSGHRYTLRTDGFISVNAGSGEGELRTKPLKFEGSALVLNASTSAAGSIRVEIQHPDGTPVAGFGPDDCTPVVGDSIAQQVGWAGNPDLGALAGKPVRLRFVMTECDLYSFQFIPSAVVAETSE